MSKLFNLDLKVQMKLIKSQNYELIKNWWIKNIKYKLCLKKKTEYVIRNNNN